MNGINISYVALNRMVEEKMAEDESVRSQMRRSGRPVLSDGRAMSDEELLAKLGSCGLAVSPDRLRLLFPRFVSAQEMSEAMIRDAEAPPPTSREDWVWIAVTCLWQRWRADLPNMEMVDDTMQAGYSALQSRESVRAARRWLETWQAVLSIMDRAGIDSIDAFDRQFAGTQSLFNWVQDFEMELHNAGLEDPEFFRHRIAVSETALDRFAGGRLSMDHFQTAIPDAYAMLGDYETCDQLFRELLTERPQWSSALIQWAFCYWPNCANRPGDALKAEAILREGLSTAKQRDRIDLLQTLSGLYKETGRVSEAATVEKEIDQLRGVREGSPAREAPKSFVASGASAGADPPHVPARQAKVGRNDACPCGSGKKYKKCCARAG